MFNRIVRAVDSVSRWWIVLAAVVVVVIIASGVTRLTFDNSTDAFFLEHDTTLAVYKEFRKDFASDEYSLITFELPPNPNVEFVNDLKSVEKSISKLRHVRRVTSIGSVRSIEGHHDELYVNGYLDKVTDSTLAGKLAAATRHPYYRDLYISKDGRYSGIVVETEIIPGEIGYKIELRNEIKAVISASRLSTLSPTVVGAPILDADVRDIVGQESGTFGALVFVIVGAGFFFLFRSAVATIIPLLIVILSVAATFGVMGWAHMPVNILTPILPSFIIAVGVSPSIFMLTRYFQMRTRSEKSSAVVARTSARSVWTACALASGTTIGALFAFSSSDIVPVQNVGITLGVGLLIALLVTFTFGVAILELFPPKVTPSQAARLGRRYAWLDKLDEFSTRHRYAVFGTATVVTLLAAISLFNLKIDYFYLGTFKEDTAIRKDYKKSDDRLPRSAAIEIVLQGKQQGTFTDPAILTRISDIQDKINAYPELPVKSYSLADVVKEVNQALHNGDTRQYVIPYTKALVAQELLLFESSGSDEASRLVTPDYQTARITVQLPNVPESKSADLSDYVNRVVAEGFAGTEVRTELTGLVPMWRKINGYLRTTQIDSILLAFGVTVIVLIVYSKSIVVGLALSFVNASVVIIVLGIMAALEIPLDPYTVLIADIAIGVLDDDTLHFFTDIRERMRAGDGFDTAVSAARKSSGMAMYGLALCLVSGFLVYAFSSVASLAMFGTLVALIIALGLVWEWLVTPAYLAMLFRYGIFR